MIRRFFAAMATLALVTAGVVTGVASPAQADCGGHYWTNRDGDTGVTKNSNAELRSGPHGYCTVRAFLREGEGLNYHCFTWNEAGNTWTHARIQGTDRQGWVWDEHLNDGGSIDRC